MAARTPRPIWSGAISFGLVNVPVRMFSATSHKELRFNMLHEKDGGRIREKRVCSIDGEEVPYEEIIKGFPLTKTQYVPVTKDELANFAPKATKSIDIEDFVELGQIDPIFFDATYYLAPDTGAARPYALLHEAMVKTGMVGVARVVLRTKQYLCAVRPLGKALAITTMHYADEVVGANDLEGLPDSTDRKPSERELHMATKLIEGLSSKFEPERYHDDYREKVMEMIEKKAAGQEIVSEEEEPVPTSTRNLADALEASLAHVTARARRPSSSHNEAPEEGGEEHHGEKRHRTAAAAKKAHHKPAHKAKKK